MKIVILRYRIENFLNKIRFILKIAKIANKEYSEFNDNTFFLKIMKTSRGSIATEARMFHSWNTESKQTTTHYKSKTLTVEFRL